jgi:hypothetical protein
MTKMFEFEPTEKGKLALAYALTGFLASGMDYSDLIEYYIDTQTAFYVNNPTKLKEDLETHGEDMLDFIGEMNKKLT